MVLYFIHILYPVIWACVDELPQSWAEKNIWQILIVLLVFLKCQRVQQFHQAKINWNQEVAIVSCVVNHTLRQRPQLKISHLEMLLQLNAQEQFGQAIETNWIHMLLYLISSILD